MPTAAERMLQLSPLASGATAAQHFLAIQLGVGSGQTECLCCELVMESFVGEVVLGERNKSIKQT